MKDRFYFWLEKIKKTQTKNPLVKAFLGLLLVFSWGYGASLLIYHWIYKTGLLFPKKGPLKVISIGNIAVGGKGKTPFALFLFEAFLKAGKKPASLLRGYRSEIENKNLNAAIDLANSELIFADTKNQLGSKVSFEKTGDEALLFAIKGEEFKPVNAKGAPSLKQALAFTLVGKDRFKSTLMAKQLGADVAILDDGLQHRKLFQDLKILMASAADFSSKAQFLPRGDLRDLKRRSKEADFIAVEEKELSWALNLFPERKVIGYQTFLASFQRFDRFLEKNLKSDGKKVWPEKMDDLEALKTVKAAAFCAIANPLRFTDALQKTGLEIVKSQFFLDHTAVEKTALEVFAQKAQALKAQVLICTEKDAVKFLFSENENLNLAQMHLALPLYYPQLKIKLVFGQSNLEKALHINLPSVMMSEKVKATLENPEKVKV